MKKNVLFGFLISLLLLQPGFTKITQQKSEKEIINAKQKIEKQLNEIETKELPGAEEFIKTQAKIKTSEDIEKALKILDNVKLLLETAWSYYHSIQAEKEEIQGIEETQVLIKKIKDEIEKAVELAKKARKTKEVKKKIKIKEFFGDARDIAIDNCKVKPEPEPAPYPPAGNIDLSLPLISYSPLENSRCFNKLLRTFYFKDAPRVLIYNCNIGGRRIQFVMIEQFAYLLEFTQRQELTPEKRDRLLYQMCEYGSGVQREHYVLISVSQNTNFDAEEVFLQFFVGPRIMALELGGTGALSQIAQAQKETNLKIVALAFNTKFHPLKEQIEKNLEIINHILEKIQPEIIKNLRKLNEVKKKFIEEKSSRGENIHPLDLAELERNFINSLPKDQKELFKLYLNITYEWIENREVDSKKKEELIRRISKAGERNEEIRELNKAIENLQQNIFNLNKEAKIFEEDLRKLKTYYPEILFEEGTKLTIGFGVKGVEFRSEIDKRTNRPIYAPNLYIEGKIFYIRHQEDEQKIQIWPPPPYKEGKIKITQINKYADFTTKDSYERIITFLISFAPTTTITQNGETFTIEGLLPGFYLLELKLIDENKKQEDRIEIKIFVKPRKEKNK